ncbi:hypothetical protein FBU59_002890 [Linderina macrospora]|uniref:Uncharacterized protein n=1 Tax=Linderina macrospora TaxID=4868 RepID=A0ACC1JA74_9FUNG|nr:hypothetical protein FBU59_002890 [Linderina macrospora]
MPDPSFMQRAMPPPGMPMPQGPPGYMGMPMGVPPPPHALAAMGYNVGPIPRMRHPNRPPCLKPSKTLYVRNLNEKTKLPVLITALRALFQTYGQLLDVRARHSVRMRGQAFITFRSEQDAMRAHSEVQGFVLFDKPMFIEFARETADATVADEGGDLDAHKQTRIEGRKKRDELFEQRKNLPQQHIDPAIAAIPQIPGMELPNKILFLQNLPAAIRPEEIEEVFQIYPGFVEVRWVSVKPDVAFVEYTNEIQAGAAKDDLKSQWIRNEGETPVAISYAKH